jgi:hypothetical protein
MFPGMSHLQELERSRVGFSLVIGEYKFPICVRMIRKPYYIRGRPLTFYYLTCLSVDALLPADNRHHAFHLGYIALAATFLLERFP